MNARWIRNSFIYLIILGGIALVVVMFFRPPAGSRDVPISEVIADLHKECEPEWLALGQPEAALKGAVSRVLGPIYRSFIPASV